MGEQLQQCLICGDVMDVLLMSDKPSGPACWSVRHREKKECRRFGARVNGYSREDAVRFWNAWNEAESDPNAPISKELVRQFQDALAKYEAESKGATRE